MAVVSFQRPGDAAVARAKYDGKYVDQSTYLSTGQSPYFGLCLISTTPPHFLERPIKIEIITDDVPDSEARAPPAVPSLLSRLGGISAVQGSTHLQRNSSLNIPT